jgi:3-deoxy-manno-octulosonate cytidylyltransferase (CMP-KDO synthetase)
VGDRTHGTVAIIPARYASSRLPGKPLLRETGKFLIQHVYESVVASRAAGRVVVATDDERIARAVQSFGGEVVFTRPDHPNGTSRVAEAARNLGAERVLNIQGDEPGIAPEHVEALAALLDRGPMGTLCADLRPEERDRPERVKVYLDGDGRAHDFDRAYRDGARLHIGAYAYTRQTLERYVALPPTARERALRLEQLRALEHGIPILVAAVPRPRFDGVDTPEDYRRFVREWRKA